jgi:DNA-binding transcriptional LysR family regulator
MRSFGESHHLLVASREYLDRAGHLQRPEQIASHPTLAFTCEGDRPRWDLSDLQGASVSVEHTPRLLCHDFILLHAAALAGLGIALLPETVVRPDLDSGRLERVLPAWSLPLGILHLVFPTRRGLLPSVRVFIDFLAEQLPAAFLAG